MRNPTFLAISVVALSMMMACSSNKQSKQDVNKEADTTEVQAPEEQTSEKLAIDGKGIGIIQIGMNMDDVPETMDGLYAKRGEKQMTGEEGEAYFCNDANGQMTIEIRDQNEDGKVDGLFIMKDGLAVKDSPIYIGMPASEMKAVDGVGPTKDQYGDEAIGFRGYILATGDTENRKDVLVSIAIVP